MKSYPIPFPKGTKYEEVPDIEQDEELGVLSHKTFASTREAKDLAVDLGTPVLAIESGIVAFVKNDSETYINPKTDLRYEVLFKKERKFLPADVRRKLSNELIELARKYTNYVQVSQIDGCVAEYVHLDKNVKVSTNHSIEQGELIGHVGMTGLTDRPHLHLNLFENISVPFELRD